MNDHHFNYPRVVPLQGLTISGHASQVSPALVSLPARRPLRPSLRLQDGEPRRRPVSSTVS